MFWFSVTSALFPANLWTALINLLHKDFAIGEKMCYIAPIYSVYIQSLTGVCFLHFWGAACCCSVVPRDQIQISVRVFEYWVQSLEYRECECVCMCIQRKPAWWKKKLANSTRFGIEPNTSVPQGDSANRHAVAAVGVIYRGSHFHSELVAARCTFVKLQRKFAYFLVLAAKRCRRLAGGTAEEAKDTLIARSAKVVWQRGWRRWQKGQSIWFSFFFFFYCSSAWISISGAPLQLLTASVRRRTFVRGRRLSVLYRQLVLVLGPLRKCDFTLCHECQRDDSPLWLALRHCGKLKDCLARCHEAKARAEALFWTSGQKKKPQKINNVWWTLLCFPWRRRIARTNLLTVCWVQDGARAPPLSLQSHSIKNNLRSCVQNLSWFIIFILVNS